MFKIAVVLFSCSIFFVTQGEGQVIVAAETRYNNSFREWILVTDDEEVEGELRMRWTFQNDWSAWDLRVGEMTATIEQKWTDDPNLWIIRCDGITVNAKTAWAGEFHRWKLNDGSHQINWESRYANIKEDWEIDTHEDLFFQMHTYREGDPRTWIVSDELPEEISMALKVAMVFITLHFSTPRV